MRAFLRRERWTLSATLALLGVALAYAWSLSGPNYIDAQPSQPTDVQRGSAGELAGAEVTLDDLTTISAGTDDADRYGLPNGTDLVVADLTVLPQQSPDGVMTCDIVLIAPSPRGERTWTPLVYAETTWETPDDTETDCKFADPEESTSAYPLQLLYLVPAGGAPDPVLQVTTVTEFPRALRLH